MIQCMLKGFFSFSRLFDDSEETLILSVFEKGFLRLTTLAVHENEPENRVGFEMDDEAQVARLELRDGPLRLLLRLDVTRAIVRRAFGSKIQLVRAIAALTREEEIGVDEIDAFLFHENSSRAGQLQVAISAFGSRHPRGRLPISDADFALLEVF